MVEMNESMVQLTAEEAKMNDDLSIQEQAIEKTSRNLAAQLYEMHRSFLKTRQDFWRTIFTKYQLDPDGSYDIESGPGGAILTKTDKMPKRAGAQVQ